MPYHEIDLARIRGKLLHENYLLGLGFLSGVSVGYVFLRIIQTKPIPLIYDPRQEISATNLTGIPARTYRTAQKFGSSALNSTNILYVEKPFHVYQTFFGVSPSPTQIFINVDGADVGQLDAGIWGTGGNYRFGYVDGFLSPLVYPAEEAEVFIPPKTDYNWGIRNPTKSTISPLFSFIINRMVVAVVRDAQLVSRILQGSQPARLEVVGGIDAPKRYELKSDWKVDPVPLDATMDEIRRALG